jgi:hypothetical protein
VDDVDDVDGMDLVDPPSHGFGAASGMDLVGGSGNDAVPQVREGNEGVSSRPMIQYDNTTTPFRRLLH